jgi:adenylate kinase
MGDIFRRAAAEPGELGEQISQHLNAGVLVPDKHVIEAIVRAVYSADARDGFVLDGYPRRADQVDELDQILGDDAVDLVVFLDVPREEAMRRALTRRVCRNVECGTVYGADDGPTPIDTCRRCGWPVEPRDDDNPQALNARYNVYETDTLPAVDRYRRRGILAEVSGVGTKGSVHERMIAAVSAHLADRD